MLNEEKMEATAKKIAMLLAESKAGFDEIPMIFHQAKSYLSVTFDSSNSSDKGEE